jgi:tetratricopeptide (TPR) repeat protein
MRKVNLKLPQDYILVFKEAMKKIEEAKFNVIYIYSPPGYGKTTMLLKFFEDKKYNPLFIQIEERDKDIENFKISFLEILSEFSEILKKTISLIDIKDVSASFFNLLKKENIFLFPNTYFIFLDFYRLRENFSKIIEEVILPVSNILSTKFIIEGSLPYEINEGVSVIGEDFFKLSCEEIIYIGNFFSQEISKEDALFLKEKTDGWILPCLLFFKDKREIKEKINSLIEFSDVLDGLFDQIFRTLSDDERMILISLGQLNEGNYDAINFIFGYENSETVINNLKGKGFPIIEEMKEGILNFRFHRLLKSYLDRKLKKFPIGYDLFFRIHIRAAEYFESIGDFENALYHAIKIRDPLKCGKYLKTIVIELFNEGKVKIIEDFLEELKREGIPKTPEFMLCEAIYLNLVEKCKESIEILKKILKELKDEDAILAEYFLLINKEYLGVNEDILIEETNKLLKKVKDYEKIHRFEPDFEKDPWKIIRRKIYKSVDYFASLMYGRIYSFLGILYFKKRELEKVKNFFEESIFFLKKIKDEKRILTIINNIGSVELFQGDAKAIEHFQEVINFPVDFPTKVYSLNNIGIFYEIFEGDLEKAEEYYNKSLELNNKFPQLEGRITSLFNLLSIYFKKKHEAKIYESLKNLEELIFELMEPRLINSFYLRKADILINLCKIDEAKEIFKKLDEIEILKFEEDRYYKFYVEGKLKYLMGEITTGKDLINKSLEWFLNNSAFYTKLENLYYLYILYKKFNDPDLLKIRKMAEDLIREKGCLKRLKDFDIK